MSPLASKSDRLCRTPCAATADEPGATGATEAPDVDADGHADDRATRQSRNTVPGRPHPDPTRA